MLSGTTFKPTISYPGNKKFNWGLTDKLEDSLFHLEIAHKCTFPDCLSWHLIFCLGQYKQSLIKHFPDIFCRRSQQNMELVIKIPVHVTCKGALEARHTTTGKSVFDWLLNNASQFLLINSFYTV